MTAGRATVMQITRATGLDASVVSRLRLAAGVHTRRPRTTPTSAHVALIVARAAAGDRISAIVSAPGVQHGTVVRRMAAAGLYAPRVMPMAPRPRTASNRLKSALLGLLALLFSPFSK